jgi:alpha-beta hydrolase superfamily lysophospholipase
MRSLLLLCATSLVFVGCSAITIGEDDVFYPKPSVTPQTFDLEDVTLTNRFLPVTDSIDVNAWHLTQPEAPVTVLFFGGNGFYLVQSRGYLRALTRPSANAFLWDYRGYGRSQGTPGVDAFRHDAVALYDYLVEEQGVAPDRLVVWGHSLGSFLATHVAQERSVAGVVLENPATNVDGWVDHLIPWYVRLFLGVDVDPALKEEDNVARVRSLQAPLLVVAGEEDNVTDPAMAKRLYQEAGSAQKDLVLVPDGGHNDLYEETEVAEAYADLIRQVADTDSVASASRSVSQR